MKDLIEKANKIASKWNTYGLPYNAIRDAVLEMAMWQKMDKREKELLDIYERFEMKKSAQGAMDFVRRNIGAAVREPVEFDLTKRDDYMPVAVDLGLPSGTKWADRNVGAKSPDEPGLFFSWGNVDGVEFGKACDFSEEAYYKTDGGGIAGDIDPDGGCDAARVNLGAPWRMPTEADFAELAKYCDCEWTKEDVYNGVRFTSKINGNSIFLPASGYGNGSSWSYRGSYGIYWSRTFYSDRLARNLYFFSGGVNPQNNSHRYYGFAVRAVQN